MSTKVINAFPGYEFIPYGEDKAFSEDSLFCANKKEVDELKLIGCL